MKKYAIWFMSLLLFFPLFSSDVKASGLSDLQPSEAFYEEISYLIEKGVISGYADGTFKPGNAVTRGEAAIMIGRLLDLDGTQRETKFNDVGKSLKASGYIASAVDKGIISGYPDGTFRPAVKITRGDMAIILSRAFNLEVQSAFPFKDINEEMAAYQSIRHIALASITAGYPDHTFRPTQKVTRAQFAAFLARSVEVKFKQKVAIKDSYAWDKTKQYTFNGPEIETQIFTYKKVGMHLNRNLDHAWELNSVGKGEKAYYMIYESYEGLASIYSTDYHYDINLRYPIKLGATWSTYGFQSVEVTGVNETVTTPYKEFTEAVEVTDDSGYKTYYVKNIGSVKTVKPDGSVLRELVDIK